ncbi:glycosyltransferase family 2 protein [Pigmentibacter ruber]
MKLVSVIMPVYNSEKYLSKAIESILNQTYKNIELLCVYDISSDNSLNIIQKYENLDSRVKLIKNQFKKNIVGALNTGLLISKGDYIARMDSDDISLSDRIKIQLEFLEKNSSYVLCATNASIINEIDEITRKEMYITSLENIPLEIVQLVSNGIAHPSVMFRAKVIKNANLTYTETGAEDYQFWFTLMKYGRIKRLPNVLLLYRNHSSNLTKSKIDKIVISCNESRIHFLKDFVKFNEDECKFFIQLSEGFILNQSNSKKAKQIGHQCIEKIFKTFNLEKYSWQESYKFLLAINFYNLYEKKLFKKLILSILNQIMCGKILLKLLFFKIKLKYNF